MPIVINGRKTYLPDEKKPEALDAKIPELPLTLTPAPSDKKKR
jgi:hypothetical protein